jgi:sugar/nucleoside kinase (ribokinase family)
MKITVIGNAIVDIIQKVDDDFLTQHNMIKGSMALIDKARSDELNCLGNSEIEMTSGGSGANTAVGIAYLNGSVDFIGNVADDKEGNFFINSMKEKGVNYVTSKFCRNPELEDSTAKCFSYVTDDAERTMCTYLGVSSNLFSTDIDLESIKSSGILYVEGYLYDTKVSRDTVLEACKTGKDNNTKIAFTLSDSFCVDRHRGDFLDLIKNNVDILFANESEILSLFETDDLSVAIQESKKICKIIAITLGANGSLIATQDEEIKIDCETIEKLVDTTGAGDNYAAGFLYGYSQSLPLKECGKLGSELSAKIIQKIGAAIY